MTTKNGALFKSTLDVVTIVLKYQLLTSSPGVAGSAAMVLESRPPIALLLHILKHKKYSLSTSFISSSHCTDHNPHLTISKGFDLVFPHRVLAGKHPWE